MVKLYVASYGAGQSDVKLASKLNLLYDEPYGRRQAGCDRAIILEGQSFQVSERVLRSPQSSLVVWTWYQIDGGFTSDDYVAKLLLAKARLFRSREGSLQSRSAPKNSQASKLRPFSENSSDTSRFKLEHLRRCKSVRKQSYARMC